jgi:nucleoside phosphorylase
VIDTIFVPRGAEADAVRSAAARARSKVRVVELGIGPLAARRAADDALERAPCGTSLVTGLCGLLSPAFAVGETLVYREMHADEEPSIALDRALADAIAAKLPEAQTGIRAFASDRIVTTSHAKRELRARTDADAVDMESYAVTERLQRRGVTVAVLRVGSDGAGESLPELDRALDGSGGIDGLALALAMLRRPRAGLRLAGNGLRALAALQHAIAAILR